MTGRSQLRGREAVSRGRALSLLRPNEYHPSVYDIEFSRIAAKGIRFLCIDIDNTLVEHNREEIPKELSEWFVRLKQLGFGVCIVSNNKHRRVSGFCRDLEVPFVAMAGKPRRGAYLQALKALKASPGETAVIGDQIFTDVLGGNRSGLYTILVRPIGKHELLSTQIVRRVERQVLRLMGLKEAFGESTRKI